MGKLKLKTGSKRQTLWVINKEKLATEKEMGHAFGFQTKFEKEDHTEGGRLEGGQGKKRRKKTPSLQRYFRNSPRRMAAAVKDTGKENMRHGRHFSKR